MANENSLMKPFLNLQTLFAVAISALTIYNMVTTKNAQEQLNIQKTKIENNASLLEMAIKQKTFDNDLKFRMYGEVKDALSKKDSVLQNVVVLIIDEMLADDSLFKLKLQNILLNSKETDPKVKKAIVTNQKKENDFNVLLKETIQEAKADESKYKIDVFYLENNQHSKDRATEVVLKLKAHADLKNHTIKPKPLPKSVNAKRGYMVSSNQIRYEPNEKEIAEKLKAIIAGANVVNEIPELQTVTNTTANYVSIFIVRD